MVQITSKIGRDNLTLPIKTESYQNKRELPLHSYIKLHKIFLLNEKLIISKNTAVTDDFLNIVNDRIIELIK